MEKVTIAINKRELIKRAFSDNATLTMEELEEAIMVLDYNEFTLTWVLGATPTLKYLGVEFKTI